MMTRLILLLVVAAMPLFAQQPTQPSVPELMERTKASTVVVLAGEGVGRLHSIATGVVLTKDGTILTALHAVKGAAEVQVRLANGDVFDRVELLGSDERRDVAALKISARGLANLQPRTGPPIAAGGSVYAVTNANGLAWSATEGIISATRPADEVPGAGNGYRLIQFTAPIAPGSSGGALVDRDGVLIGIITKSNGNAGLAVPIESVLGLQDSSQHMTFGSGSSLQMPANEAAAAPQSSAALANSDPKQIVKNAKTIVIRSKTAFLTVDTLDRALLLQKLWPQLGLTIVNDARVADLMIDIDRPLFTYVHTYVITDKRTSIVLDSGKVTAFDGTIASNGLSRDIVKFFTSIRLPDVKAK